MLQRFRKIAGSDGHAGLSVSGSRVAYARVREKRDGRPQIVAAAADKGAGKHWAQELTRQVRGGDGARLPLVSTLPEGSYQLLLVEVPDVPADEVNDAIRWKVKDLLDFPVDETVIELLPMPSSSMGSGAPDTAYAVATRRSNVEEHIRLLQAAGFPLEVINIPELCMRNIAARLPQDSSGVAFLHLTEQQGILTVSRQGTLYMIRRIDRGREYLRSATDDFARTEALATFVLDIQRSLDYYETHFDRRPLTELVLGPGSDIGGLADTLREQLGLNISQLDLNELFDVQNAVSEEQQNECLLAIGAALRVDPVAA